MKVVIIENIYIILTDPNYIYYLLYLLLTHLY